MGAAQTLRSALAKVEAEHPGFSYDLIKGILRKAEVMESVDMTESLLRMEGMNNSRGNVATFLYTCNNPWLLLWTVLDHLYMDTVVYVQ